MVKIKDENFINIQGWMINRLKLKGNELLIYAIIYGFTQDGEQWFEGSKQYLADWCNITKRGAHEVLKSLVNKRYLLKEDIVINNVTFCKYKVNFSIVAPSEENSLPVKNLHPPGEESSFIPVKNLHPPGEKSSPNNIDNNINNNNIKKERKKGSLDGEVDNKVYYPLGQSQEVENLPPEKPPVKKVSKKKKNTSNYDDILEAEVQDEELIDLYVEFIKMRNLIKAPLTDRALKILIKRVNTLEPDSVERQKELLNIAIMNNWKSVYELKDTNKSQKTTSYNAKEYESTNIFDQLLDKQQKDVITVNGDDIF